MICWFVRFERGKFFEKRNESRHDNVLTFGFLTHMRYPQVLGAITLAVDSINKDPKILPKTRLDFKFEHLSREYFFTETVVTQTERESIDIVETHPLETVLALCQIDSRSVYTYDFKIQFIVDSL